MVNLTFYNTPDEENVINKTKNNSLSAQGLIMEPCDILNPKIRITANTNLLTKNYLYIDSFNRYYFITGFTVKGAEYEISARVDALESHYNDFKDIIQKIDRQEYAFNVNLVDNELPLSTEKTYQLIKIGTSPFHVEDVSMAQNTFFPFILNACNVGFES